jgi:hypothetical protein
MKQMLNEKTQNELSLQTSTNQLSWKLSMSSSLPINDNLFFERIASSWGRELNLWTKSPPRQKPRSNSERFRGFRQLLWRFFLALDCRQTLTSTCDALLWSKLFALSWGRELNLVNEILSRIKPDPIFSEQFWGNSEGFVSTIVKI